MTTMDTDLKSSKLIHILAEDEFGKSVLRHLKSAPLLAERVTIREMDWNNELGSEFTSDDLYVLISGSPMRSRCLELDDRCHKIGSQFMPVTIESPILQVGPLVTPGLSPCWECWDERVTSQHAFPEERLIISHLSDQKTHATILGFMPYTVEFAAHQVSSKLLKLDQRIVTNDDIWRMNIFNRDTSIARYVGRHGCHKCGSRAPAADRTIGSLDQFVK